MDVRKDYVKINNNGSAFAKKGDFANAFRCFLDAANHKIPAAQYNLGVCYEYGNGTAKNISVAVNWYRKAASLGYKPAKEKLASLANYAKSSTENKVIGNSSLVDNAYRHAQVFLEGDDPDKSLYYITLCIDFYKGAMDKDVNCLVKYVRLLDELARTLPYLIYSEREKMLCIQSLVLYEHNRGNISNEEYDSFINISDWLERYEYINKNKVRIIFKSFAIPAVLFILCNTFGYSSFQDFIILSIAFAITLIIGIVKYKKETDTSFPG